MPARPGQQFMTSDMRANASMARSSDLWLASNPDIVAWLGTSAQGAAFLKTMRGNINGAATRLRDVYNAAGGDINNLTNGINAVFIGQSGGLLAGIGSFVNAFPAYVAPVVAIGAAVVGAGGVSALLDNATGSASNLFSPQVPPLETILPGATNSVPLQANWGQTALDVVSNAPVTSFLPQIPSLTDLTLRGVVSTAAAGLSAVSTVQKLTAKPVASRVAQPIIINTQQTQQPSFVFPAVLAGLGFLIFH